MLNVLQSQEFMRDPASVLGSMREQGALVKSRIPIIGKVWFTTTHAAAVQVLKNDQNFTVRKHNGSVVGLSWWMPDTIRRMTSNMLAQDNPEHARLRGIVDQAFQRREIISMEQDIGEVAHGFANALFDGEGQGDLVSGFARPLPLAVISELLGLPENDREGFMKWADSLTNVTGMLTFLRMIFKLRPMSRYIEQQISIARTGNYPGLIGELVGEHDEQLSDDEFVSMVFLLLFAGHETTTHLISGSVLALMQHREQLEELKADWSLLDLAVEECLRFVCPVQTTKPRFVQRDCEVDGVELKAGEIVMPLLVAANMDPALHDMPERFDITRKPNRHTSFGSGIHFCLGHQLARLELRIALRTLFTAYPDLDLVDETKLVWRERLGIRALKRLPLTRR